MLGLASGPACVASCGPVVVPTLLAEHEGVSVNLRYLSAFLVTRLIGYLIFAAVAWQLGTLVSLRSSTGLWVFAVIHILLAAILVRYAFVTRRGCISSVKQPELVTIGPARHHGIPAVALLGLLTGVSLCPPFVAAGVRAAQAANLLGALVFFAVFFLGTGVWFLPFLGMSWIRRNEAVLTVARMTMVLIAVYYFYVGVVSLLGSGRNSHG